MQVTSRTYIKKQTHEHWFFCHTKILEVESLNNNFGILLRILGSQKSLAELQQRYQPKQLHYSSLLVLFWSLTKTGSTIFCNIINIFCFFGGSGTKSSLLSITAFPRLRKKWNQNTQLSLCSALLELLCTSQFTTTYTRRAFTAWQLEHCVLKQVLVRLK